jgi:hypothetical protein
MKWIAVLLFVPAVSVACQKGYVPTDVPGVCQETGVEEHPKWISDEKPPENKMPSYQREGITVIDAPNMAVEDEKQDAEKRAADAQGKKAAGL